MTATRLQTPRKTAAGLGSAKGGTGHFIQQRVTAIALVALVIWFLIALVGALDAGYASARDFIANPVNAVLLVLLVTASFHHMRLGLQDVIEDYAEGHGLRAALLMLNVFAAAALWVVAVLSILRIAL
jgi:succinate dehydrogenase / fumarate reductase membrane anchor subunit